MSTNLGFWGFTASVNWCEPDYHVSPYVAEFWNTVSSAVMALVGLMGIINGIKAGIPGRFIWGYLALNVVGLGSMAFHGTLLFEGQAADELSMMIGMLMFLFCILDKKVVARARIISTGALATLLISAAIILSLLWFNSWEKPILFQASFVAIEFSQSYLLSRWYKFKKKDGTYPETRKVFLASQTAEVVGAVCWVIDHILCGATSYIQWHAIWHCCMAIWAYNRILLLSCIRPQTPEGQRNKSSINPDETLLPVKWIAGVIPINARVSRRYSKIRQRKLVEMKEEDKGGNIVEDKQE
eukprot:TRINITY_DN6205_c1_g1_i2.p1 TRINITY_DN6205_c1_g1~~TRINITY_DN6205_c1_g1_i2.p1  ORF type:complete len:309 (+),score=74.94 TRINITY_DN6205_c1_g1_i2:36-929(+)